jgi:CrcB protein
MGGNVALYAAIAIGSALGGMFRYWCSVVATALFGPTFPWGTLIVNVVGSVVIGFFAAMTEPGGRWLVSPTARQFVTVGFCGGYTTFSSFSLQTLALAQDAEWGLAAWNIVLSVALCLLGVWLGHVVALALTETRAA